MQIEVNGTRLWFDVDGPALVPDGPGMRERPTLVLIHGGPGSYDHSYFKPWFGALTDVAQVVYLDLRDHGRSGRDDPERWTLEQCADDVRAFCDTLGIARPIVLGHSLGGFVAILYGERHPGHAGGLIFASTMARFDLHRLVEGFRVVGGDEVAELARRDYSDDPVTDAEWDRVFAAFGPHVPTPAELRRVVRNDAVNRVGSDAMERLDLIADLPRIDVPTLVVVGAVDSVTPVGASREIVDGLAPGIGRLEVIEGAGHFAWLDEPDRWWVVLRTFIRTAAGAK